MPKLSIVASFFLFALTILLLPYSIAVGNSKKPIVLISGPETNDLLNKIGKPLLEAAGMMPDSVKFHVMLNPTLNAMALPSNDIIFNSGLLQRADSIDEVAGVMAHEIAHLSAGHHIKLASEMKNVSLQTLLFGVMGVAAGAATGSGKLAQATMVGGTAMGQAKLLSGRRQKETQSDRLAIHYMVKAGYDPHGLTAFMERIQIEQQGTPLPPPYLLSHPLSSSRVVEIRQMANENRGKTIRPPQDNRPLKRVQAKLYAGTAQVPSIAINHFRILLKKDPDDFTSHYGLAVALRYAGQLPESEAQLNYLLKKQPNDPYLFRERGRTRMDWGRAALAEIDFRVALKSRPKDKDLLYWLAFAMKEQEKYRPAGRILRRLTIKYPKKPHYFYLLGMVEGKGGKPAAGHLALGRHYALILDVKTALWHFDESIRLYPANTIEHTIATREKERLLEQIRKAKEKNWFKSL